MPIFASSNKNKSETYKALVDSITTILHLYDFEKEEDLNNETWNKCSPWKIDQIYFGGKRSEKGSIISFVPTAAILLPIGNVMHNSNEYEYVIQNNIVELTNRNGEHKSRRIIVPSSHKETKLFIQTVTSMVKTSLSWFQTFNTPRDFLTNLPANTDALPESPMYAQIKLYLEKISSG